MAADLLLRLTGYKNARFGKIEAHEAINAISREKLLVAKETAEKHGFRVLQALVDSLYVQKEDATRAQLLACGMADEIGHLLLGTGHIHRKES